MKIYILKTYAVIVGTPKYDYETEYPTEQYTNEETALNMVNWWRFDQGRRDTELVENYIECPVVDDCVVIPENINR